MEHPLKRLVHALVLVMLVAPGIGQVEEEPYFGLSSGKTFAPGEKASVQLSAYNVDALDFRVYRVSDPVKFFESLEDAHQFGGRAPKPPHEQTLLERFHAWKRRWYWRFVNTFREQFTRESRARIRDWRSGGSRVSGISNYAQAPLLNKQQVVSVWRQKVTRGTRWEERTIPINAQNKGVYLVEATYSDLRAYTIVMISDLAMITKTAPGHVVSCVVNRESGAPIAGVPITLWSAKHPATDWKTSEHGLIDTTVTAGREDDLRLMAHAGEDFAANTLSPYSISSSPERDWTGYVYTDRPVYRPGHTVDFKAILRRKTASGYSLPGGLGVTVEIHDPDQKPVYRKDFTTSRAGTLHGEFVLPAAAALGNYFIQLRAGEASMSGYFGVEEYKKPEYEVRVTPTKPRVLEGDTVQATIEARYYFGEPVKNAKMTYAVYRDHFWSPLFYMDREDFETEGGGEDEGGSGQQIIQETGQLDADGKLTVNIPTTLSDHKLDYRYRIEAGVTDEANREISGTGFFTATYGSFAVNIEADQYVYAPGARGKFTVRALDYDGHPIQTLVKVDLQEWRWNERDKDQPVKASAQAQTDGQGEAKVELRIPGGGEYRVRVSARTPENRIVESYSYVWVSGGDASIYQGRGEPLQIVPDKKTYRPGDVAKILIVTGVPRANVLVTVEGKQIESTQMIAASAPSFTVEIPVKPSNVPNFFVNAAFIRGNRFYEGSKMLKVPPIEKQLQVQVTTSKPQYRPREQASYAIDVKDNDGRPVSNAEFSLGVVDEAIYAIRKDTTEDILQFFYGREYNVVSTESSLSYYFRGEAGKRRMMLAMMAPGIVRGTMPLAQLKPERLVQPKIRKLFPDTTYWGPEITTNAQGHATAQFAFPDSLTTWRATARGVSLDTKVGSAIHKTIVRKNLILRLAVPRFFTQDDEVTISGIVHNYLPDTKTARVSLEAKGLEIIGGGTRDVTIPSRSDVKIDWRVRAKAVAASTLTGKALTDEESDAIELTLPIHPQGVQQSEARGGSLAPSHATAATILMFPAEVAPASRSIDINVAPSIAGALFGALDYLTAYPYGCTEQTMSSFVPNIVVAQALKDLKIEGGVDPLKLREKINAGLERLYDFQHPDGGWGWWKTDDSQIFMTAYVVAGLSQARGAGQTVRPGVIERGTVWLTSEARRDQRLVADLKAYIQYALVLAGKPDSALLEDVWQQQQKLSPYGQALLGLTLDMRKDARAKQVAAKLESSARQNAEEAWWPQDQDYLMHFFGDETPEATAFAVKLLAHLNPQSPLLPKAALWLMNHRNEGMWWYSTKQTAMVVYGLTDYLKLSNELKPDLTATVFLNDKQVLTRKFGAADALSISGASLHLLESDVDKGTNRIRIEMKGDGRLYWSARAGYWSLAQKLVRTGTVPLNILRDYFTLTPIKVGESIEYQLNPLSGAVSSGDIVAVRLTVTGGTWRYLLIEDPIPAGAEFIEHDDLYHLRVKPSWWRYWFSRREMHDDHMAIFQTYFDQGQRQYFYLLKIVNPGQFHANPARVQPMYQPEFLSTTESRQMEVK